jgi:hypothetical protein
VAVLAATLLPVVEHKDVVLAVLGAASAIGGLLLVFLGLLVGSIQSFDSGTAKSVLRPFKIAGTGISVAFLCSILAIGFSIWWLVGNQPSGPYGWSIGLFIAQLFLTVLATGWVLVKLIWQAP